MTVNDRFNRRLNVRQRRDNGERVWHIFVGVGIVLCLLLGGWTFTAYNTKHHRTVTVCGKEAVATKSGHDYRVYTNTGTFVVADSLFGTTRFDSADVYGRLEIKTTYDITYKGWRIPVISEFPNILELHKSSEQHSEQCE